jgi:hypothetical protein
MTAISVPAGARTVAGTESTSAATMPLAAGEQEAAAGIAGNAPDPVADLARRLYPELF